MKNKRFFELDNSVKCDRTPAMARSSKILEVYFDSELHHKLHEILVSYKFGYMISHDRRVGRNYHNLSQYLRVDLLDDDGGQIEVATRITDGTLQDFGRLIVESYYTPVDWRRIMAAAPNVSEMLERELSVLTKSRHRQSRIVDAIAR